VSSAKASEKDARISGPFLSSLEQTAEKYGFTVWFSWIQVAGRKVEIHEQERSCESELASCHPPSKRAEEVVMEKRMLSLKEFAHYIGLAPQTIKNQFYGGRFPIPPKRIGRKLLWDKKTVDRYLDNLKEMDC
jgi:predicted DNA-binding transcriptional regulator AlpA